MYVLDFDMEYLNIIFCLCKYLIVRQFVTDKANEILELYTQLHVKRRYNDTTFCKQLFWKGYFVYN